MNKLLKFLPLIVFASLDTMLSGCTVTVPHQIISAGPNTYIASFGGGIYTSDSGAVRESV